MWFSMRAPRGYWRWLKRLGDGGLVAAFDLLLDYGDISERFPSKERIKSLQMLHLDTETIQRRVAAAVQGLQTIRSEKAVRVWLAPDRPGDLCGLCWLMEAIDGLPVAVQVVPFPAGWNRERCWCIIQDGLKWSRKGGNIISCLWRGWSER